MNNGQRTTVNGQRPFIPYGRQQIDEDDIQAVVDVLRSDWITQGPKVKEFEDAFTDYVGARFAVAVNSGTAALHLACLAAGIGSGDEVLTSPITFVATANCALYVGATPAFVDIDPMTFNLDPKKFEAYLQQCSPTTDHRSPFKDGQRTADMIPKRATENGKRIMENELSPRAVIPVHFAGLPCDMPEIHRIAKKFNLIIIEDACHALGAKYKIKKSGVRSQKLRSSKICSSQLTTYDSEEVHEWVKVGSCMHSDMTVFSFHPVKHITTGEGGMITTNNEELYEKLLLFRNHGITRDADRFVACSPLPARRQAGFTVYRSKTDNRHHITDHGQPRLPLRGTSGHGTTDNGFRSTDNRQQTTDKELRPTVNGQRSMSLWYYEMQALGYNYRISDIQCALGLSQLKKMEFFVQRRRFIAKQYSSFLKDHPVFRPQMEVNGLESSYHLYVVCLDMSASAGRDEVMDELRRMGIGTQVHYIPVYRHPLYRGLGLGDSDCANAEIFFRHCLSLPIYPAMSEEDIDRVLSSIEALERIS